MKLAFTWLSLIVHFTLNVHGQSRTITGKVIDYEFHPIPHARVYSLDTTLLASTDPGGNFRISLSIGANSLLIGAIGAEMKLINFSDDCGHLEIIMLWETIYDFVSSRKVDKERRRQYKSLPFLHRAAFSKGVFSAEKPCFNEAFIPSKH